MKRNDNEPDMFLYTLHNPGVDNDCSGGIEPLELSECWDLAEMDFATPAICSSCSPILDATQVASPAWTVQTMWTSKICSCG